MMLKLTNKSHKSVCPLKQSHYKGTRGDYGIYFRHKVPILNANIEKQTKLRWIWKSILNDTDEDLGRLALCFDKKAGFSDARLYLKSKCITCPSADLNRGEDKRESVCLKCQHMRSDCISAFRVYYHIPACTKQGKTHPKDSLKSLKQRDSLSRFVFSAKEARLGRREVL